MNALRGLTVLGLGTLLISQAGLAGEGGVYYDRARVVDVEPVYDRVEVMQPERHCWDEDVTYYRRGGRDSYTPTIAGAIVGGVVGNQFGHGRSRDVLTVAGALLGGSVGRDLSHRRGGRTYTTTERRCEVVDRVSYERRLSGYKVQYRYKGRTFTTFTDSDPGKQIRVAVDVEPVDEGRRQVHHPFREDWDI